MTRKFFLAAIIFLAAALGGCGIFNKADEPPNKYVFSAIKNPQKMEHRNLSVYKPGDWQEVKKDLALYFLPPGALADDPKDEKIIVAVYSLPEKNKATLANLMKVDLAESQKKIPGLKFVYGTEDVKLGPLPAREEKYEALKDGQGVSITQLEARSNGLLYKIQHYCAKDECHSDDIFSEMAGSFEPVSADHP